MLDRLTNQILSRFGYRMIPRWRETRVPQADYLRRFLQTYQIELVIDVGANRGQYYDFLRQEVGYTGTVWSFEPLPDLARGLEQRAQVEGNWQIFACALGEAEGTASINRMAASEFSSLLAPSHAQPARFKEMNRVTESIPIRVRRLDEVLAETLPHGQSPRTYLKLDTQGYDLAVLRGASACLPKVLGLQTEASVRPLYEGMPDYRTAIAEVETLGFRLSAIFPVNPDKHFPELIEFDCHLVAGALV